MAINTAAITASISAFMAVWQLVGMLVPLAKQLVQTAESLFPAGGQGATKLEWVRGQIEIAFKGLDGVVTSFGDIWPKLADLINLYVSIANKAGWGHNSVDPNVTVGK